MKFLPKPILWGIGIFLILFVLIIFVTFWFEKNTEKIPEVSPENIKTKPPPSGQVFPNPPTSTVMPDSAIENLPRVRFRDGIFSPAEISVQNKNNVGCFLVIANESNQPLSLRLGPYEKGKEKGFSYPSLLPGTSQIIDPRYTGISDAVFYHTANPSEEFIVHVDGSCN